MTSTAKPHKDMGQKLDILEHSLFFASLAVAVFFLFQVLKYCQYGLDFTDEGFYLNWISNPWIYSVSTTQFGFVYHFLYRLVGEDVVLLRQANVIITVGLAWSVSFTLLKQLFHNSRRLTFAQLYGCSFLLSVCSLLFLRTWLISPSYNSLTFQALLITTAGFLNCRADSYRHNLWGWMLIGAGGWLAFMAKPTTAAALATAIIIGLVASRRLRPGLLAVSSLMVIFLTGLSAWIIDHSLTDFIFRIQEGAHQASLLGGGHSLTGVLRWDSFSLNQTEQQIFTVLTIVIFAIVFLGHLKQPQSRLLWSLLMLISLSVCGAVLTHSFSLKGINSVFLGLQPISVLLGCLFAALLIINKKILKSFNADLLVLFFLFLLLPHIYAFGTGNNYWQHGAHAAFFWVLSGFILFGMLLNSEYQWRSLLSMGSCALLLTIAIVSTGMEFPYRQPQAVYLNNKAINVSSQKTRLIVSEDSARYINGLTQLFAKNGIDAPPPMIDLTGRSPGTLFALGAKALGQAWMIGGYKGSETLASKTLEYVPCEDIAASWILIEVNGSRVINHNILTRHGIELSRDYQLMGSLLSSESTYSQQLWKPIRLPGQAFSACNASRTAKL